MAGWQFSIHFEGVFLQLCPPNRDGNDDRIRVDNFQTCGSKEGSLAVVRKTLETMSRLKHIDPGTALFVWLFSNSGTGPECSIDEIPNDALQFLFEANKEPDFTRRNHAPGKEKQEP